MHTLQLLYTFFIAINLLQLLGNNPQGDGTSSKDVTVVKKCVCGGVHDEVCTRCANKHALSLNPHGDGISCKEVLQKPGKRVRESRQSAREGPREAGSTNPAPYIFNPTPNTVRPQRQRGRSRWEPRSDYLGATWVLCHNGDSREKDSFRDEKQFDLAYNLAGETDNTWAHQCLRDTALEFRV